MSIYNIAFDINNKLECLNYYSIEKKKGFIYNSINHCEIKPIGNLLLEFLNLDLDEENDEDFFRFVTKYCFKDLLFKLFKDCKLNIRKYFKKDVLLLTEPTLSELLLKMYSQYVDDFIYYQGCFVNLLTDRINDLSGIDDDFKSEFPDLFSDDSPNFDLTSLSYRIDDLKLDFTMDDFYFHHKELSLSKNIPYSFISDDYLNILFISFKQLLYLDNDVKIKKCANCNKYFIPKTMHDTKYCDEIFKDNKTCKEIGRELTYKESLAKSPLLKSYRSRYQTLSKQASEKDNHEMYEYFKKIGPEMRKKYINSEITAEEFQNWINSTKFRKK